MAKPIEYPNESNVNLVILSRFLCWFRYVLLNITTILEHADFKIANPFYQKRLKNQFGWTRLLSSLEAFKYHFADGAMGFDEFMCGLEVFQRQLAEVVVHRRFEATAVYHLRRFFEDSVLLTHIFGFE